MTFLRFLIPSSVIRLVKRAVLEQKIIKWRARASVESNARELTAHLLVVKDPRYCFFARVCAFSFLHFHPNSSVVIHSDKFTHKRLSRAFRKEIARNIVKVEPLVREFDSWQEMKIFLISQIQSTKDFFVDADMRFRGVIPPLKNPTLFVREFKLSEMFPFSQLSEFWYRNSSKKVIWMFNSSFVWLGSNSSEITEKLDYMSFQKFEIELEDILSKSKLENEATNQIWRLREQIFLSLVASSSQQELVALKTSDARLDGQFLESAYFGSTGLGF